MLFHCDYCVTSRRETRIEELDYSSGVYGGLGRERERERERESERERERGGEKERERGREREKQLEEQ